SASRATVVRKARFIVCHPRDIFERLSPPVAAAFLDGRDEHRRAPEVQSGAVMAVGRMTGSDGRGVTGIGRPHKDPGGCRGTGAFSTLEE
ncbi:MAG: hypothetical protein Q8K99_07210, partial [Actinomycetota bacterium]|nr:hypothetical protein [Actinomycetota bacterium]